MSSDVEDMIEVIETVPAAPQSKRMEINAHLKERIVATKVKALTAKAGERPTTMAATLNHSAHEKVVPTANAQIKVLTDLVKSLLEAMEGQTSAMEELRKEHANQIEVLTRTFSQQIETLKVQVTEMTEKIETQLSNTQPPLSASPSYAEVARTPPSSGPSNVRTLTSIVGEEDRSKAQPGAIRRAIEEEIRTMEGQEHWRCVAVSKDARNYDRIRVTCRDETELQRVKKAADKTAVMGVRVLRDQLYPVKVDNANRTAILDQDGKVLPGVTEALGKENDVHIAKIAWLSRKDIGKAYGSMVVYVTKGSDAARLVQGQYFHVTGESAYTRVFEPRYGPLQCYKCQELGHKAFSCTKPQVCARCAQMGHHHSECRAAIPKCVPCGGPHESFSKNCQVLYPARHE
jgi:hypothetical protein